MDIVAQWKLARANPATAREFMESDEIAALRAGPMPPEVASALAADTRQYREIAADFGVSYATVAKIKSRHGIAGTAGRPGRLPPETVREIYLSREPGPMLAARYGIGYGMIAGIRQGRYYTAVTAPLAAERKATMSADETRTRAERAMAARHEGERRAMGAKHKAEREEMNARHIRERAELADKMSCIVDNCGV